MGGGGIGVGNDHHCDSHIPGQARHQQQVSITWGVGWGGGELG